MNEFSSLLDTIAAVSTPRGKGGVALIRISGPDASLVLDKIFVPAGTKKAADCPRKEIFGKIVRPEGADRAGEYVDSGLAVFFKGPASFTGDDTAEICCHGGTLVTAAVLEAALLAGARQAEAGEFTRRAFASGKLSLPEAEALGLLLDAKTDAQMRLSHSGMNGSLTEACGKLHEEITALLTDIYARIDFPEEDLGSIPLDEIIERTDALVQSTDKLSSTYKTGRAIAEGIKTVICGKTNVGKSTLYNMMSNSDDAIVTDIAGTTRDVLSSVVSFGGVTLNLSDTAGIRAKTGDTVEAIGIERAKKRISDAELILFLIDSSREPSADDYAIADDIRARLASGGTCIALLTKNDIEKKDEKAVALYESFGHKVAISAKTGEGREEFEKLISGLFIDGTIDITEDAVVSSARQYETLSKCREALVQALDALKEGYPTDIASVCLEDSATFLSELDGRGHGAVSADVIDGIFSKFCVGK